MTRPKRSRRSKRRRDYSRDISRHEPSQQSDGKTFLIVVEGLETERRYLLGLRARLELKSADVFVEHAGATDPQNIVTTALKLRDAKREQAETSVRVAPYDEVWVVIDREAQNHARGKQLPDALTLATSEGISVALSNPCFEFWLLLHYVYTTKPFADPQAVIAALREHDDGYEKDDLPLDELFAALPTAVKYAEMCLRHHHSCRGDGNPSTYAHSLALSLNRSAAPVFQLA
jgi:RloB-like protein